MGGVAVLVVDDEVDACELVRDLLTEHGHEVVMATSGPAALAEIEERPGHFGLVLTDIRMPGMDGFALQRRLGVLVPTLPVRFITGDVLVRNARIPGQQPIIRKPFELKQLLELVRSVLG
jgi:CheY-like chemotaxis protein